MNFFRVGVHGTPGHPSGKKVGLKLRCLPACCLVRIFAPYCLPGYQCVVRGPVMD